MRVVIHQPYFLPWLGYFSKLAFTDIFIVLDNVNFRKRHYHDRTQIVNMHSEMQWIGVPVGENFQFKFRDVLLPSTPCCNKLTSSISHSYAHGQHFLYEISPIKQILADSILPRRTLLDANMEIITRILQYLEIPIPQIYYSSDFSLPENATDRIIILCQEVGANEIVVGGGSSRTVHEWRRAEDAGIRVLIQDYMDSHPVYRQTRRQRLPFQAGLSIVDSLLNVGHNQTREFITSNDFIPLSFNY